MRTTWGKNAKGEIWNFTPKSFYSNEYGCLFSKIKGTGYETKLVVNSIGNDFSISEKQPTQVPISGYLYFRDYTHLQEFERWKRDDVIKFYYDGAGKIDPRDQISKAWYKEVYISKLDNGEEDASGFYVCAVTMTPLSAMWRRDAVIATTISGIVGDPHVIPFYYPYFYQSERKLYLSILNEGERIGCKVVIKNNRQVALNRCAWTVDSSEHRQYAEWLADSVKLESGRTLIIDSNARSFSSVAMFQNDIKSVVNHQECNPQYINYVDIYSGQNQFLFDLDGVDGVDVSVEFSEQTRTV